VARVVVALGGNAILQRNQVGTIEEQLENVSKTAIQLAAIVKAGHEIVVTHGNGPQVGNLLLQNEEAFRSAGIPPMPLDVCGAESQGMIGYMLQRTLRNDFRASGLAREVVCVVTQVLVKRDDPAFASPTKPVGPFYTAARAERVSSQRGYVMKEDAGRGWRRVVPSPDPQAIVETESIRRLVESGCVVIASGGGGIPVALDDGVLTGVEAVIDKDLAAQRLATDLGAAVLLILTDVERVALDFGRPSQRYLDRATAVEMRRHLKENQFKPGSMQPKVEACVRFIAAGGQEAIVTSLDKAFDALSGAGTHIIPPSDDGACV